jgi:hypothetical protein
MNMEPVVNGLEEDYRAQIEFRALNAADPAGQRAFQAYALPGHPGYVLIDPGGEVLWKGFGELSGESIRSQLDASLSGP